MVIVNTIFQKGRSNEKLRSMSRNFARLISEQQVLSDSNTIVIGDMQVSIPAYKQRKFPPAEKKDFFIHLSLLGGFLGLVGYLVIVCHHVH
jgi:hypothetical protein